VQRGCDRPADVRETRPARPRHAYNTARPAPGFARRLTEQEMAAKTVKCAKLGEELPGIDEATPAGRQALKMCLLIGGPELRQRVLENVSARAWEMWTDQMRMIINEYHLDPTSDASNTVLGRFMEEFFFGRPEEIPNYVPPE
jgi:Fe-S cluster biosynthesis and repair protein YggX